MDDTPHNTAEARGLTFLRRLVTVLTATMIAGLVILIALFVTRFPDASGAVPLPDSIALPDGARATAFTRGPDWFAVVTEDERILILDAETGALRQTVTVE
ncbi:hypothetical protein SAMN04490244_101567 [Tranquillimonas rosea]|uniref:Uncharacterized protein n=1 Tax=Tranquillimonas rosea TaxID=641238 RepID=A0A1H9QCG7_9RHOB|nr:DUF6476 family protein [Tranquillimonas rosea]SER58164.1 hypothetical protein SAMN04490244_101567 [Tranquillimonas rosea]